MPLGVITGLLRARKAPKTGFLSLSPKRAEKNYYKGKGCINYGRLSTKGGFLVQMHKLPRFVVPDLTGFKLKPYVAHNVPKIVLPEKLAKAEKKAAAAAAKRKSSICFSGNEETKAGPKATLV